MIMTMPAKYMDGPTQGESLKNTPAKRAITGNLAPHGMKGVNMAVVRRWRSSRMVLVAIIPGIAHPVPMIMGMMDLPESPTFLK